MKLAVDKAWLRVGLHTGYTPSHVAGFMKGIGNQALHHSP